MVQNKSTNNCANNYDANNYIVIVYVSLFVIGLSIFRIFSPSSFQMVFQSHGGVIKDGEKVINIEPGDLITVTTDSGTYQAKNLVITAGPWAKTLLSHTGLQLPLQVLTKPELCLDNFSLNHRQTTSYIHSPAPSLSAFKNSYGNNPVLEWMLDSRSRCIIWRKIISTIVQQWSQRLRITHKPSEHDWHHPRSAWKVSHCSEQTSQGISLSVSQPWASKTYI